MLYAVVDTEVLRGNLGILQKQTGTGVIAVLKHNAYSHGALACARALSGRAAALAVSSLPEALALQDAGLPDTLMVLDPVSPGELPAGSCRALLPVDSLEIIDVLQRIYMDSGVRVQLRVDLAGSGVGLAPELLPAALRRLADCPALAVAGVFAHVPALYRSADVRGIAAQFAAAAALVKAQYPAALAHIATSASRQYQLLRFDAVRIGTALYGLPSRERQDIGPLRPALRLCAPITRILPGGGHLSFYDGCVNAARIERAGLVAAGYGQLPALLAARGLQLLVRGQLVPAVGTACMGRLLVDLTGVPEARAGDAAVFVGASGQRCITAEQFAARCGIPACRCDGALFTCAGTRRIFCGPGGSAARAKEGSLL